MEDKKKAKKYSKETVLKSKIFADTKDMINAIWENDKEQYTKKEVQTKIDKYLEKEV